MHGLTVLLECVGIIYNGLMVFRLVSISLVIKLSLDLLSTLTVHNTAYRIQMLMTYCLIGSLCIMGNVNLYQ